MQALRKEMTSRPECLDRESQTAEQNRLQKSFASCSVLSSYSVGDGDSDDSDCLVDIGGGDRARILTASVLV